MKSCKWRCSVDSNATRLEAIMEWERKEKREAQELTLTVFLLCVLDLNEVFNITENSSFSMNFIKMEQV